MELKLESKWYDDGLQLAKWSPDSKKILSQAFYDLRNVLARKLGPYCMHLKGRGGIKGAVRCIHRQINKFPFAARFDVDSYYNCINHNILFNLLKTLNADDDLLNIIKEYVLLPDKENKGMGIIAGGALSTLLGAVYLSPLDFAMDKLYKKGDIFYIRYMDELLAKLK